MHHSPPRPPRGSHPVADHQRTTVGLVLFALVMAVVMAGLLYPPIGVAAVTLTAAAAVGRAVVPRLRCLVQPVTETTGGTGPEPKPGLQAN